MVQALYGMGGVGRAQLAAKYAHLFAGAHDLAYWVNAEQAGLMGEQFAALSATLRCVESRAALKTVQAAVLAKLR